MRLCDEDPSSNAKAVCFEKSLYDSFEPLKTYDIINLKVKKGFANDRDLELLITPETQIKDSVTHQFKMERSTFTIDQILRRETHNIRFINLKAKILSVEDITTVGQYPNQKKKRDVLMADTTGEINLVLWEGRTEEFDYRDGDIVMIENAVVSSFNKTLYITTSTETSFEVIDDEDLELDEARINMRPKPQPVITTLEAPIQAFKEFKSLVKCVNCQTEILHTQDDTPGQPASQAIKCGTCSATFLLTIAPVINECKFLVLDQWYTARKTVSCDSYSPEDNGQKIAELFKLVIQAPNFHNKYILTCSLINHRKT